MALHEGVPSEDIKQKQKERTNEGAHIQFDTKPLKERESM